MNKAKIAFALNVLLFACCAFAVIWMFTGVSRGPLAAGGIIMLRYFTVDSNILMGVIALVVAIDQWAVVKGKKSDISLASYVLKIVGTASVTLTMLVTVFFLTPTMAPTAGPFALFMGSNFFMHLFNPVLAIVVFTCFEKTDRLKIKHVLAGAAPMFIYAIYYVYETLAHTVDGVIQKGYDWYGFFFFGTASVAIVVPLMILITFGISFVLYKLNRRKLR